MAKFSGKIGFRIDEETRPGVWKKNTVEKQYYGDVIRNVRNNQNSGKVNEDITISNEISIVSDSFLNEHYSTISYVVLNGIKWKVNSINIQYPRLVLSVGGLYNG